MFALTVENYEQIIEYHNSMGGGTLEDRKGEVVIGGKKPNQKKYINKYKR